MSQTTMAYDLPPNAMRWTRDDCKRLEESGVLNYRYELVEGAIIKIEQNTPHALLVSRLLSWLFEVFGVSFVLSQCSIDVRLEDNPTSELMPDVVVLNKSAVAILSRPKPEDIRLIVEVSDTTLRYDMTTKAALYARAGIPEYWVTNLSECQITIYRSPSVDGYSDIATYGKGEQVAPMAAEDKPFFVYDFFS